MKELPAFDFIKTYMSVMSDEQYNRVERAMLQGKECPVTMEEIEDLQKKLTRKNVINDAWYEMVARNNLGIKAENENDLDSALKHYERNVDENFPGTHPYERLMVIYRKMKQFDEEIRVIERAIAAFTLQNKDRLNHALSKTKDSRDIEQIKLAYEQCKTFRDSNGMVIFSPYPVNKYIKRKEKVIAMKQKISTAR